MIVVLAMFQNQCIITAVAVIAITFYSLNRVRLECPSTLECRNNTSESPYLGQSPCSKTFPREILAFENHTNVNITLCNGRIYIENEVIINDSLDFRLQSYGVGNTELFCNKSNFAGFKFANINSLQISNVTFDGCGGVLEMREIDNSKHFSLSGLTMSNCTNITLVNVMIKNSPGNGLVLNQTRGYVSIVNTSFDSNCKDTMDVLAIAGGLYVEFVHYQISSEAKSFYSLDGCQFRNNHCEVPTFKAGIGAGTKYGDVGKGGGASFVFKENSSNNHVTIRDSVFFNNYALRGGGLRTYYSESPLNNTFVVRDTEFVENESVYSGAGVDITFAAEYDRHIKTLSLNNHSRPNSVRFEGCNITKNVGRLYGGGFRTYSSRNMFVPIDITFSQCSFTNNTALYGPAVDILPRLVDVYNDGFLSKISFKDCNFTSNEVTKTLNDKSKSDTFKHYDSGKGVFSCSNFFLFFGGHTQFKDNSGSAMYLLSCRVKFESESFVEFTNNSGFDGGAVVLFGGSVLYVNDNSTFTFVNNTAVSRGGAVMYFSTNEHDFVSLKSCFIQYLGEIKNVDERFIQFSFQGNKAMYGQAVFASTLRPCQRLCVHKQTSNRTVSSQTSLKESFGCIGRFDFSDDDVSTSGEKVYDMPNTTLSSPIPVIPGQELTLPFKMFDELSKPSYDVFYASVQHKPREACRTVRIDQAYTHISEKKVVKLYGKPGELAELVLTNTDFQPIVIISNVKMEHCPPGFVLNKNLTCVCSADNASTTYVGITRCNTLKGIAYIRSGYWVGYDTLEVEERLITGQCPRRFCQYRLNPSYQWNEYELPKKASMSALDSDVCGVGRMGKLCGNCRANFSVFFHSVTFQCERNDRTCQVGALLYLISELLPVTILFLTVILFDIRLTSGTLNSLLFYVQIIDSLFIDVKGIIKPHPVIIYTLKASEFIYGMFNMNFFASDDLSFCMWKTASTLDIFTLKYITITYSLVLVVTTVTVMKFCNPRVIRKLLLCNAKQFSAKTSIIHGLVAFLVICYAQSTRVSLLILTPGKIHSGGSAMFRNSSDVVYHHGDLPFMREQHLKYAIPAIFFTVAFTILPPLLLIVYPLCYKVFALLRIQETTCVHFLCMVMPLEKLRPFFDSFQGCFQDKYRFFAGLYFLYRLAILTLYAATDSLTLFYTLLEVQLVAMLILHAVIQPYKHRLHNALDTLLVGLLAIINALTMYNYQIAYRDLKGHQKMINIVSACQALFSLLPVLFVVAYTVKTSVRPAMSNGKRRSEAQLVMSLQIRC